MLEVDFWCVEDPHLCWWVKSGPGKSYGSKFQVHICHGDVKKCKGAPKRKADIFHTDLLRTIELKDVKYREAAWWISATAKKDFEGARTRFLKSIDVGAGEVDDDLFEPDMASGEFLEEEEEVESKPKGVKEKGMASLAKKLEELKKADPAKGAEKKDRKKLPDPVKSKAGEKKERNPATAAAKKRKGEDPSKEAEGGASPKKKKVKRAQETGSAWFGRPQVAAPEGGGSGGDPSEEDEEDVSSSTEAEKKKKKKKKDKSGKKKKGTREKKDRGPYGSGRRVSYGKCENEETAGESEESENSFQAGAPEKRSQQLVLMEYADQKPGRLAARLLQKMALLTNRTGAPVNQSVLAATGTKTPPAAVQYYHTVLLPQNKDKMNLRLQRELQTLTQALDYTAVGAVEHCADLLCQRLKALELNLHDQSWSRAQFLELIPLEGANLADTEEQRMAAKEQVAEARSRQWLPYRGGGRGEDSDSVKSDVLDEMDIQEEAAGESDDEDSRPTGMEKKDSDRKPMSKAETFDFAKKILTGKTSYATLGTKLLELVTGLDTPLGRFVRSFSSSQSLPATGPPYERRGDILPLAPSLVKPGHPGITKENIDWVRLTVIVLNYYYCCGWGKVICVPMDDKMSPNQQKAVTQLGHIITRNIIVADVIPPPGEVRNLLNSKRFDYAGNPVEHMLDLDSTKVVPMWPRPGKAGVRCITDFLDPPLLEAVGDPSTWWLPDDRRPMKRTRSRVRASDETWYRICQAAHERNMMKVVPDGLLHKDRNGYFVTNGAGGVVKKKEVNGKLQDFQRFISVLIPTNEHSEQLPGAQDSLPYIGQLTGIILKEEDEIWLDSEDFTSAFNLFSVPDSWLPHFAFEKKVDASAFGGQRGIEVRPALSVIPMGWKSAVTLVQAAVRKIVFGMCKVPVETSVQKDQPLPSTRHLTVVYLDNFDELRRMRAFGEECDNPVPSEAHKKFIEVCDSLGLARNEGKQLVMALTGGIQGGELDGRTGVLRLAPDKLRNFIAISLGMMMSEQWKEFHIRHWVGKAAFVAAFKRPLFSILESLFPAITRSLEQNIAPGAKEMDEVITFLVLAIQAESDLRAQVLREVSCSDASPTGGGSAVASRFKSRSLVMPEAVAPTGKCVRCNRPLQNQEGRVSYPCPRKCGEFGCSVACAQAHCNGNSCRRKSFSVCRFGERFSGPNFPLTKAVALEGVSVQKPMDILIKSNPWDFFTPDGKEALETEEEDPALRWRHWGPNCRTFSRARGKPIYVKGKGKIKGPPQIRSEDFPWGFDRLSKDDQVKVRQDNKMAKRSLKGLDTADKQGGYAALEHPYNSFLWYTDEAIEMESRPGWMKSTWSHCCFGGRRTKWTSLLRNSPRVHAALHKLDCQCTHQEPLGHNSQFFLRTMEVIQLTTDDIHLNVHTSTTVVTLESTKTSRRAAQSLVVQNATVCRMVSHLLLLLPKGKIWKFSPKGFRQCYASLLETSAASSCNFTIYSLRRGGATHAYVHTKSLDYVAVLGRWKDYRTARIYLDDARAALLKMALPSGLRACMWQYRHFWRDLLFR
eukprot:Skav230956  [mRNA]  locus=scaffold3010:254098:259942:- [translate_table: standard]